MGEPFACLSGSLLTVGPSVGSVIYAHACAHHTPLLVDTKHSSCPALVVGTLALSLSFQGGIGREARKNQVTGPSEARRVDGGDGAR